MDVEDITGVGRTDADTGFVGTGAGKRLGGILGSVYTVGKLYDNYNYWNDYAKNTGNVKKYKFRRFYK